MLLDGKELAGYIKAQQAQTIKSLQFTGKHPKLAIIQCGDDAPSDKFIELKREYGQDIGAEVEHVKVAEEDLDTALQQLNTDELTNGIIIQLPLPDSVDTDTIVNQITPEKDVDGLGENSWFDPAAPTAILWLLGGYDISLSSKQIGLIGQGRLVGAPLADMLRASGAEPLICDEDSGNLEEVMQRSDIVVSATGAPGLIKQDLSSDGQVIVDAGTAYKDGKLVGDVDQSVYSRKDIKISPVPGGVGPLTVCALFGNLIEAFKQQMSD